VNSVRGQEMENNEEETPRVEGFLLNEPNRVLAEGRLV
jgi:hypothetical protein